QRDETLADAVADVVAHTPTYSTIATFWYCPPEVPELEFRATIQGHYKVLEEGQTELRRSLAASRHYFDYEIADQVIAAHKGRRKGIRLGEPGVEVISAFRTPIGIETEIEPQEKPAMGRVSVTEEDKQRVLAVQEEMNISTQHATMQVLLDAADTAIALANVLECQPIEVAEQVEALIQQLEKQKQQEVELKAKLSEAEQMMGSVGHSAGTNKVIEQSLSMAHEFNDHLKQENGRLKGQLTTASQEIESLRSQLARFEASQQQLQQLQQLFSTGGINIPAPAAPQQQVNANRQPVSSSASGGYGNRQTEREYVPQPVVATEPLNGRSAQAPKTEESYSDQTDREVANLIREIMQYNDQQAADDSERWMINQSTLKRLTTRNQAVIKRVLEEDSMAAALEEHHNKYGLHGRVANRGKDINLLKAALGIQ
ncbi:MAG: hypothetical protein AAF171_17645, partial [Cyanobacteria bacterium P01_A01_bin.116]